MKKLWCLLLVILVGCDEQGSVQIANFESPDVANKVIVLLAQHQLAATLSTEKESYRIYVDKPAEAEARQLLTQFNFYFQREDLNDLLESKFASLSKLEMVKSNLLESREIYNKLSVIPNVLRASVVVTGEKNKRISVLIMSLKEIDLNKKSNIERFLKGLVAEQDTLTVSYFVQMAGNESV
ncbi:type III secretion protein [Vibrio ostreicida]|uniref:Type III secretion protein n=1 Tax=Vibrio ostreicida TaxID=526588 RepID=A0ABT8BY16_9VIBR|nr:type III secretion protein [Vibrio ostreicida]MDN3612041.1 type III secretion protein [Vibrio ostreicida]NPD08786.1 type III secretion protein [Vibrio ostreicida]